MAAEKPTNGEKKTRKPAVRKPKILNALIGLNAEGRPEVLIASFNAFTLLAAVKANPSADLVEVTISK